MTEDEVKLLPCDHCGGEAKREAKADVSLQLIPPEARGLQLCRNFLGTLRLTEAVKFEDASGVELTLRRAAVSGQVSFNTPLEEHWADILDANADIIGHVSLDAGSFKALKGHWMRCKYVPLKAKAQQ